MLIRMNMNRCIFSPLFLNFEKYWSWTTEVKKFTQLFQQVNDYKEVKWTFSIYLSINLA